MAILNSLYYIASILLCMGLITMIILVFKPSFILWLQARPNVMFYLVGVEQLPKEKGVKILKRFYCFLGGGWTWIIIWSWWLMPMIKDYLFKAIVNEASYKITRISLMIIIAGYAAVGFFAIGKAITIWLKELYTPQTIKKITTDK